MERSAMRISSIFSSSSGASDKSNNKPLPTYPALNSRDPSPARLLEQKSTLHTFIPQSSSDTWPLQDAPSPNGTPNFGPVQLSPVSHQDIILPPPRIQPRSNSPSRSRPGSGAGSSVGSRPASPIRLEGLLRPSTPNGADGKPPKRRSWLQGKPRGDSQSDGANSHRPGAWLIGQQFKTPYDVSYLASYQKIPDLWDENGDALIYLFPRDSGKGPSFRVDSSTFASSKTLTLLAHGESHNNRGRGIEEGVEWRHQMTLENQMRQTSLSAPALPPKESHHGSSTNGSSVGYHTFRDSFEESANETRVYIPVPLQTDLTSGQPIFAADDVETLVVLRNLFAFLCNKPLVATSRYPDIFSVLMQIANFLEKYEFANLDNSNFGEVPKANFSQCINAYNLADVRLSREKTIEAIVLGEQMRSWELYNEGFVHGVGKFEEIAKLESSNSKYQMISTITRNRMEKASMDLYLRLKTVRSRLEDFEFPSLFAGIANSTSSTESKMIRFKSWKSSFLSMRRHTLAYYRDLFGAWPPKANSRKNDFEESGLNRILLRELYQDFSDLYDILVDRNALTSRSADVPSHDDTASVDPQESSPRVLRRLMSEYDRSSPPVQPPIPFDIPQLPSPAVVRMDYDKLDSKKQAKVRAKQLIDDDINLALMQSYNRDSIKPTTFLEDFMKFERKSAHGMSIDEITDLRIGQWIFMYAVLQSLPMVVVDAPGIKWSDGVEYFLCEIPKGTAPWSNESKAHKMSWYGIAGSTGVVSLPADVVDHGVHGVYNRSHCWRMADRWTAHDRYGELPAPQEVSFNDLLPPPPILSPSSSPYRSGSPYRSASPDRQSPRNSVTLGLEALPMPDGVAPSGSRPQSKHDPTKSFTKILGQTNGLHGRKGK